MSGGAGADWYRLYDQHRALRSAGGGVDAALRRRIAALAGAGAVPGPAPHRLTYRRQGHRRYLEFSGGPVRIAPETLREGIEAATLDVRAAIDGDGLVALSLTGQAVRRGGETLVVAVHLTDAPQGAGACGHALLHAHVGTSLDAEPQVRVPLPALAPATLLDWVLSQLIADHEAAPWPKP